MYIISGEFQVKLAQRAALKAMSLKLVPLSLEESGCLSYSFLEDHSRPGYFMFFERWQSREDIAQHFEKPYFAEFAAAFPAMIEGEARIEIHQIANTELV